MRPAPLIQCRAREARLFSLHPPAVASTGSLLFLHTQTYHAGKQEDARQSSSSRRA